tara:strand:+ start:215 stop:541 length:327 start_codon:yes stop_codon:yes gene_type:complete
MKNKRGDNRFFIKDKKGLQLAISTIILMILGIVVLIGLITILVMGWDNFKMYTGSILGSSTQQARKVCKIQCGLENTYDYCCEDKEIGNCTTEILQTDCSLDCKDVSC